MIDDQCEWRTWAPLSEMVDRQPELEQYRSGMAPGLDLPLGPRGLYIFGKGKDTLHGNMDKPSSGQAVSIGCARLLFQDLIGFGQRLLPATPILVVR